MTVDFIPYYLCCQFLPLISFPETSESTLGTRLIWIRSGCWSLGVKTETNILEEGVKGKKNREAWNNNNNNNNNNSKLSLNVKKTNFVIFHPSQKRLNYKVNLKIYDNNRKHFICLERKDYVKYLGVLIDSNLIWKHHISHIASKISKSVGIICRLRHLAPFSTLLNIYRSLIYPYLSYGLVAWGQAAKSHMEKILILQKRVVRLMNFANYNSHAVPYFISANVMPINMLYVKLS